MADELAREVSETDRHRRSDGPAGGFAEGGCPVQFEGLLDDVEDLSFRDSVKLFEGLEYWYAPTQETQTFKLSEWEEDIAAVYDHVEKRLPPQLKEELQHINVEWLATIHGWTKAYCYIVNSTLRETGRNMQSLKPVLPFMKNLTRGLHGLPSRFIVHQDLFRADMSVRTTWNTQVYEGALLEFWTYTSFSSDPKVLKNFFTGDGVRTLTRITDGIGYDIQCLSFYPRESEILLEAVTKIRVRKAEVYDADHALFKMGQADQKMRGLHIIDATQEKGTSMLKGSPVRAKEEDHLFELTGTQGAAAYGDSSGQRMSRVSTFIDAGQAAMDRLRHNTTIIDGQLAKITKDEDFVNVMHFIGCKMIIIGGLVRKFFMAKVERVTEQSLIDFNPELPAQARLGIGGALLLYGGHVKSSVAVFSCFDSSLNAADGEAPSGAAASDGEAPPRVAPTLAIVRDVHARISNHKAGNFAGLLAENVRGKGEEADRPLCKMLSKILGHPVAQVFLTLSQRAQVLGLGLHFGWAMATRFGASFEQHLWDSSFQHLSVCTVASRFGASDAKDDRSIARQDMSIAMDVAFLGFSMPLVYFFKQSASLWTSCCLLPDVLQVSRFEAQFTPQLFSAITFLAATGYSRICDKSIASAAWKLQGVANLWQSCLLGSRLLLAGERTEKTHFLWMFSGVAFLRQMYWIRTNDGAVPPFYGCKWIFTILSKAEGCFRWFGPDLSAAYGSTSKFALVLKMQDKLDSAIDMGLKQVNAGEMSSKVAQMRAIVDDFEGMLQAKVEASVGGLA